MGLSRTRRSRREKEHIALLPSTLNPEEETIVPGTIRVIMHFDVSTAEI